MKKIVLPLLLAGAAVASAAWAQPTEKPEGFLCCNMRSAHGWISDINYENEGEQIIPLGTPLKVTGYGFNRAHVLIDGQKQSIGNDYSRTLPLNVWTVIRMSSSWALYTRSYSYTSYNNQSRLFFSLNKKTGVLNPRIL